MNKVSLALAVLATGLTAGCQTPPNIKQMQDENAQLQSELNQANAKIANLQQQERQLQAQINELNRVMAVLDTEKTVRVQESSELRGQVRRFVQNEIDELKDFMVQSDLLDYVGGELVQRSKVDNHPMLLVDLANPMPASGTLTGVSAHFIKPGTFTVQVMRPVQDQLLVIWKSGQLTAPQSGVARINFPLSVGVEQGDVIGYMFHQPGVVSFDEGTGSTLYTDEDPSLGQSIKLRSLDGSGDKRAYSVGVYGLLN
ncbi:hypothetical protein [Gilvimarinus sp. DA14]|uniref:hypothetical protein n=1 Tax=Gilvimarinus sp. DA14 TaxID=2956798 RepID=UPI0020B8AD0B|nr:hypothetical protein [Gilvimarinus sp. DA14]UTF61088.1 hypothetical protein NHM04_04620 [Gilvimarinus sp. DA14]